MIDDLEDAIPNLRGDKIRFMRQTAKLKASVKAYCGRKPYVRERAALATRMAARRKNVPITLARSASGLFSGGGDVQLLIRCDESGPTGDVGLYRRRSPSSK